MSKKIRILLLSVLAFSLILPLAFKQSISPLLWVNTLFFCALILFMVGGSLFVIQGEFFTRFILSFKYFLKSISKTEKVIEEIEGKKPEVLPYQKDYAWAKPIFLSGILLLIVSIIISFFYF